MAHTTKETGAVSLSMQPPTVGALCSWNPNQPQSFPGEDELRASYGAEVMDGLAENLDRFANTGSERKQFTGTFPNFIHAAIFSVDLDVPLRSPRGAGLGTSPLFPRCLLSNCNGTVGVDAHWTISGSFAGTGLATVANDENGLCLDVKDNTPKSGASVLLWSCNGSSN